jgi:hypothetical protein
MIATGNEVMATEYAEPGRLVALLVRLLPAADRETIVGDLLEDAYDRDLSGTRLQVWLIGECGLITARLSLTRLRGWLVLPPVRELVSGLAVDGRGAWRGAHPVASVSRALLFCGTVVTMMLGVEILVSTLLAAF